MPTLTGGGLIKLSFVLRPETWERLQRRNAAQQQGGAVVRMTDTVREALEQGLDVLDIEERLTLIAATDSTANGTENAA
jgi:hypothetical protein